MSDYTLRHLVDAKETLDQVEYYFRVGRISREVWDDYRQLWRLSAPRFTATCEADEHRPITQAVYDELARMRPEVAR